MDWNSPAARIHNRIRGLSPWPVAETSWKGMELKVHKALLDGRKGKAGEVLDISKEGIVVAAGIDAGKLIEIQPPSKKKMNAYDFILGHRDFKVGEMLS